MMKCEFCGAAPRKQIIMDIPGGGREVVACDPCAKKQDFAHRVGLSHSSASDATFVRYVGTPAITGSEGNAFGSVLAEMSDGSRLGFICVHGGSEWLCLSCAEQASGA